MSKSDKKNEEKSSLEDKKSEIVQTVEEKLKTVEEKFLRTMADMKKKGKKLSNLVVLILLENLCHF